MVVYDKRMIIGILDQRTTPWVYVNVLGPKMSLNLQNTSTLSPVAFWYLSACPIHPMESPSPLALKKILALLIGIILLFLH